MPGSVHLFNMHALLESDYAILTYILHSFALCRGPKSGGMAQYYHPKYVPGCAYLNGDSILVTAWNHSTSVFKRCGLLILLFIKSFIYNKIYSVCIFWLVLRRLLVDRKENSTGFSTGLTGRSKNLDPTGRSTRPVPVDPTGFHLCCELLPLKKTKNGSRKWLGYFAHRIPWNT